MENYNPQLKKLIIEVVENQIRDNNPPIAKKTYERLISCGYSSKIAKEKIAAAVVEQIYYVLKANKPFDIEKYTQALTEIK